MKDTKNQTPEKLKILVLGVRFDSREIKSFHWNKLPSNLNLEDFEVVIMDLTQFENDNFIKSLPIDNLFEKRNFSNFLFSPSNELIIIGYPYSYSKERDVGVFTHRFIDLFPYYPPFLDATGETICDVDNGYEFLFRYIGKWNKHLVSNVHSIHYKTDRVPKYITDNFDNSMPIDVFVEISPIAKMLTQHSIAFSFTTSFLFSNKTHSGWNLQRTQTAKITNLPPTTTLPIEDEIKNILTNRFQMYLELVSPEWVNNYKTKAHVEIESNIIRLENERNIIEETIHIQNELLLKESKYQRLLYEQGDNLQAVVHDAFELLGAEVDRKDEKKDDGKITYDGRGKGILEVKGKKSCIERENIRQLEDWKDVAEKDEGFPRKGILVANCFIDKELKERAESFPEGIVKKAINDDICLLKTSQIFKAIYLLREGKFNKMEFWRKIFTTNGVVELDDI